ncbi:CYFA0S36e00782g1_1 [Cyberlindnera fabianii]|uniref:CYFA0S36e00782g1_1 n=1 Tax=Cyberlindnera fabianii TaxID=36022 RepID=A0A061BIK4_CYBFA|nr:Ribonuclease P protein subunit RPR2 [Cyberlindnera fabianii]CDR47718.1 CYFA0S36e00782g1_1 [Cyberlindnera fabianii]
MSSNPSSGNSKTPKKAHSRTSVPNKDGFSRASFLLQAATATSMTTQPLSRMYLRSMDLVTKKSVLKVDPIVKRVSCKKCDRLQIPNVTSTLRLENEGKKTEMYQVRCICGTTKRYPVGQDRQFKLFTEKSDDE